jgi:hypothetical protein
LQLVNAWKKSGQSTADFAAACGVLPGTLAWWRWKLGSRSPAPAEDLRLVAVEIAPAETTSAIPMDTGAPAWEFTTARGETLRVYRGIAPAELAAVLLAMGPSRERR